MRHLSFTLLLLFVTAVPGIAADGSGAWPLHRANAWQARVGWRSGANFMPSTAVNAIECWQQDTFDPATIDRELGYAESLGFTIMRVWLNSLVWRDDPEGFKRRVKEYLAIADRHHIGTMFVFFDDCWTPNSKTGPQPPPSPGVHNSRWVQDPSRDLRTDTTALFAWLETYVKDILRTFKDDPRVLVWDMYNEPNVRDDGSASFALLRRAFAWGREIAPSQPMTVCIWTIDMPALNRFAVDNADIITYHSYEDPARHLLEVRLLQLHGRPMICTEYMARHFDSKFQNILPMLRRENVGAINWGLVAGKINTMYKWGEVVPDGSEPSLWFHDILRRDGTPFDPVERDTIRAVNTRR